MNEISDINQDKDYDINDKHVLSIKYFARKNYNEIKMSFLFY